MLSIGEFASMTGLSVKALRHYDEKEVLVPADVDPGTGYRRYGEAQVRAGPSHGRYARPVCRYPRLRWPYAMAIRVVRSPSTVNMLWLNAGERMPRSSTRNSCCPPFPHRSRLLLDPAPHSLTSPG